MIDPTLNHCELLFATFFATSLLATNWFILIHTYGHQNLDLPLYRNKAASFLLILWEKLSFLPLCLSTGIVGRMTDCRVYRILCIGDSRLRYLQYELNNNQRAMKFSCYVFPGATMGYLAYQLCLILAQCGAQSYDYIVIAAGICDITTLEKTSSTHIAKPAFPTISHDGG